MENLFAYTFHRDYPSPINDLPISSTLAFMANASPVPPAAIADHVPGTIHILVKTINTRAVVVTTPEGLSFMMEPQFNEEVNFPCKSYKLSKLHAGELESFISGTVVANLHICGNVRRQELMEVMTMVLAKSIALARGKGFSWVELTAHIMLAELPAVDEGMAEFSASKQLVDAAIFIGMMQVEPCGGAGENCAVCCDELLEGVEVARIYCSHVFHTQCIGRWLRQNHINRRSTTCPTCRAAVTGGGRRLNRHRAL